MSQTFEFSGQSWRQTIFASDTGGTDSIMVTLSKVSKKSKDGKLVYKLRESQTWSIHSLNDSSVEIDNDLTAAFNVDHPILAADFDLIPISGKGISNLCDGNIKRRAVQKKNGGTFSLTTNNSVFNNVTTIPKYASVTTSNGKCGTTHKLKCPGNNEKSVSGYGFMGDNSNFMWTGNLPASGSYGRINVMAGQPLGNGAMWSASYGGTVVRSRIEVENDLSKGTVDASGLPKLSGTATTTANSAADAGTWDPCGSDKEYRLTSRGGTPAGDLSYTPTGMSAWSVEQPFSFEAGSVAKTAVRDR